MKITQIELKDFRAFGSIPQVIPLANKNLLVYGENGSGKSSLYNALKYFLEANGTAPFLPHRNFFVTTDDGYVRITLDGRIGALEWSSILNQTAEPEILEANKTKGFLDYKTLLKTYFIHQHSDWVNLFDLVVKEILVHIQNDITGHTFGEDWQTVLKTLPTKNTKTRIRPNAIAIKRFNDGLKVKLDELKTEAQRLLDKFGHDVRIDLFFGGVDYNRAKWKQDKAIIHQEIRLRVTYAGKARDNHHHYLNEARLSAIALSLFFAALRQQPASRLRLMVLDDVLIGLDMENRQPVLDILETEFTDWQIVLLTYDKPWFDLVKDRFPTWKSMEQKIQVRGGITTILCSDDYPYLDRSQQYWNDGDMTAAANAARSGLEDMLKIFCERKQLLVRYVRRAKKQKLEDTWQALERAKGVPLFPQIRPVSMTDTDRARTTVLNPMSHPVLNNSHRLEVQRAINAIRQLKGEMESVP